MTTRWLLALALPTIAVGLSACGEGSENGGPASHMPVAAHVVDPGVLQDPTGYQPATFEPLPGSPAARGSTFSGGGGAEDSAIRTLVRDAAAAILGFDGAALLDSLDPQAIAPVEPLRPDLISTFEKVQTLQRLGTSKLDPAAAQASNQFNERAAAAIPDALASALVVEMLSPTSASISLDGQKLTAALMPLVSDLTAMAAQAAGAAPEGAAGGDVIGEVPADGAAAPTMDLVAMLGQVQEALTGQSLLVKKVDDAWKFELPVEISESDVEVLREVLTFANTALDSIMAKLQAVDQLTPEVMERLQAEIAGELTMPFMALMGRISTLIDADAAAPGEQPVSEPAAETPDDSPRDQRRPPSP